MLSVLPLNYYETPQYPLVPSAALTAVTAVISSSPTQGMDSATSEPDFAAYRKLSSLTYRQAGHCRYFRASCHLPHKQNKNQAYTTTQSPNGSYLLPDTMLAERLPHGALYLFSHLCQLISTSIAVFSHTLRSACTFLWRNSHLTPKMINIHARRAAKHHIKAIQGKSAFFPKVRRECKAFFHTSGATVNLRALLHTYICALQNIYKARI